MTTVRIHNEDVSDFFAGNKMEYSGAIFDPPYHIQSMVKRFAATGSAVAQYGEDGAFTRRSQKWVGEGWDSGRMMFDAHFWEQLHTVMRPGAIVLAYSSSDTYDQMAMAARNHFDILYPIARFFLHAQPTLKMMDGDFKGYTHSRRSLKPAFEIIGVFRKSFEGDPVSSIKKYGCGAFNVEACATYYGGKRRLPSTILLDQNARPYVESSGADPNTLGYSYGEGDWIYSPRPSRNERNFGLEDDNPHPSVKPIAISHYLATLIKPPDRYSPNLLNLFSGTGSEAIGAMLAGWGDIMMVEKDRDIAAVSSKRMAAWKAAHRTYESCRAKDADATETALDLEAIMEKGASPNTIKRQNGIWENPDNKKVMFMLRD